MKIVETIGTWLYFYCVDFMVNAAILLEITYRDTNSLIFFVLWPVVTIVLIITVLAQRWRIRARRRSPASPI